ncbi:ThuA domain-containing protein [Parafrankia sp. BMG5.11]|uniref:ThuA domain-containing protein n=1 Tax=Parafrankia sp. BMG5.11 TaxID=222540 RepID=UPI00103E6729|nr:ThuA domain-containing protein [Parafrankia sp. BMG5.11]TCJ37014.1 ThuA domain-containing protein [Parafrankia sp. BMG5.11]
MKRWLVRLLVGLPLTVLGVAAVGVAWNWDTIQRVFLGGLKVYETEPPVLPTQLARPAVLVFSKTNAFRHEEAIPAAKRLLSEIAEKRRWGIYLTDNGATFAPELLARFDVVVFNNVSGDVFTPAQRSALRSYLENGGGFVGIHAAGDNSHPWPWYVEQVIGARFIGHPMDPQFQRATVNRQDADHPAGARTPARWKHRDEWYSFAASPRRAGVHVIAAIDERSYSPGSFFGTDLAMGSDHPVAWWRCVGKGRAFYTAMGHTAASYSEPEMRALIGGALDWANDHGGPWCSEKAGGETARQVR